MQSRRLLSLRLALLLVPLAGCDSGGGGGSSAPGRARPGVEILEPAPGAVVNTASPNLVAAFSGPGLDLDSIVLEVDGVQVSIDGWTRTGAGLSGPLPPLADGAHAVEVSLAATDGARGAAARQFEVSTGGGATRLRGRLLDPDGDRPIAGARIYLEETPEVVTTTGPDGAYLLEDGDVPLATGQDLHLMFDTRGLSFTGPAGAHVYPLYKRKIEVAPGALNQLAPCYLPAVRPHVTFAELAGQGVFDCAQQRFLEPYTLSVDVGEGTGEQLVIELTIPAYTYVDFLDGAPACDAGQFLAIAPVDKDKAPSALPPGADPSLLITVQPTGMKFRVSPGGQFAQLPISFPNRDDFEAGTRMILFSVDHDTGEFAEMGTMEVDPSHPSRVITIDGGLEGGSWHCSCPPEPDTDGDPEGYDECSFDQVEANPTVDTRTGFYTESYELPTRILFDEEWGDALVFDSRSLNERTILSTTVTIPLESAVPDRISLTPSVAGAPVGEPIWFDTSGFPENTDSSFHLTIPLDVQLPDTGLYPYQLAIRNHFATSSVTAFVTELVPRVVRQAGGFGQGWNLASDARIHEALDGSLLLVEGAGTMRAFAPEILGERGLRMTLYPYGGPPSSYYSNQVLSFFEGRAPMEFTELRDGEAPVQRQSAVLPNLDFPQQGSGDYYRHAGLDGVLESSHGNVRGDDIVFRTDGHSGGGDFGALVEGYLYVPYDDQVRFRAAWDNGVAVEVDGQTILAANGSQGTTNWATVDLTAGLVPIRIASYDYGGARKTQLYISGAGYDGSRPAPPEAFFLEDEIELTGRFTGTRGDFSEILRAQSGTYERLLPDGGVELYGADGRVQQRVDRRGRSISYERQGGVISRLVDPAGGETIFELQGGRVGAIVDPVGRRTELVHQGDRLVAIVDPAGARREYAYDVRGFLVAAEDEDGHENTFAVDAAGRMTRVDYADGTSVDFRPYNVALLDALDSASGTPEDPIVPLAVGQRAAEVRDPDGRAALQRERPAPSDAFPDAPDGSRLWVREVTLEPGRMRWELVLREPTQGLELARQLRVGTESGGWSGAAVVREERTSWDVERGLPVRRIESGLGVENDRESAFAWHPDSAWLTSVQLALGSSSAYTVSFEHDEQGNVTRRVMPVDGGGSGAHEFNFNERGQMTRATDPTGVAVEYSYDPATGSRVGRSVGGSGTDRTLDATGRPVTITRPGGATTVYGRDPLGRVTRVEDPLGNVTRRGYTASGRLAWVQGAANGPGERHRLAYDPRGRLQSWTQPLGGVHRFEYTASGALARVTDPRGVLETRSFDAQGRLERIEYRRGDTGPVEEALDYAWTDLDQLASLRAGSTEVRFSYSPFGEPISEVQSLSGSTDAMISRSFDALGRLSAASTSLGQESLVTQSRAYGSSGQLTRLTGVLPGLSGAFEFEHDAAGRRTRLVRPGGIVSNYSYDPGLGMLSELTTSIGGAQIVRDSLSRDVDLDIERWAQDRQLTGSAEMQCVHDESGRLASTSSVEVTPWDRQFGPYDPRGNPLGAGSAYDAEDRLVRDGDFEYAYDAAGNLVERRRLDGAGPVLEYEWSLRGELKEVRRDGASLASYTYDGLGRRVTQTGEHPVLGTAVTERYIHDGDELVAIRRTTGVHSTVLAGPESDEPLAISRDGVASLMVTDALGSVTAHVEGGAVVEELRYGPFGEVLTPADGSGDLTRFAYRGRLHDRLTGLHQNRARYYDPALGRFLSRDGLEVVMLAQSGSSVSHPYAYGASSPLRFSDPSGLAPQDNWYRFGGKKYADFRDWVHGEKQARGLGAKENFSRADLEKLYKEWKDVLGEPRGKGGKSGKGGRGRGGRGARGGGGFLGCFGGVLMLYDAIKLWNEMEWCRENPCECDPDLCI